MLAAAPTIGDQAEMADELLDQLPLPQRLALAYSPAAARERLLAFFAFDARLGAAIRQSSEPLAAQIRLAWWRDQLRLEADKRERADMHVAALDSLAGMRRALFALVDGWELLLGEEIAEKAIRDFAVSRGDALAALAKLAGASDAPEAVAKAGTRWALADLAAGLSDEAERRLVAGLAGDLGRKRISLSRQMRSLAILDGLARRSLARGGAPLLDGPAGALLAMRLGLVGR